MVSIKQILITHPIKKVLLEELRSSKDWYDRMTFCYNFLGQVGGGTKKDPIIWNPTLPIPNKIGNAWLLVTFKVLNNEDYEEYRDKFETVKNMINSMEK